MPVVLLQATINGQGEEQQLYCPGTVDHSHKLTFKLDNGTPPSNSYVPLSYAVIDQRTFFKMDGKDIDIDAIISSLNEVKTSIWPFAGEEYANVEWVAAEQPETHIQVSIHYRRLFDFRLPLWFVVDVDHIFGCWYCVEVGYVADVDNKSLLRWELHLLQRRFHIVSTSKNGMCSGSVSWLVIQDVPGQICHTLGEHSLG